MTRGAPRSLQERGALKLFSPSRLEIKCGPTPHANCLGRMNGETTRGPPVGAGLWRICMPESSVTRPGHGCGKVRRRRNPSGQGPHRAAPHA